MAEDLRTYDPRQGDLSAAHSALKKECAEQSRNTLYTSTSFYIWLRWLKGARVLLWVMAGAAGAAAASASLTKLFSSYEHKDLITAGLSLLAVILPGVIKGIGLDEVIQTYAARANELKTVEGALRRAANVWSHRPYDEFEKAAREALDKLDAARSGSLTPPEWCFKRAHKKIKAGHYDPD